MKAHNIIIMILIIITCEQAFSNTNIFFTNTYTIENRAMCQVEDQVYNDGDVFTHPNGCGLWYV